MFKVLIVDDAKYMREVLKNVLTQAEFEIIGEAEDGIQALEKYKELHPDIVTMDISMPNKDGIEALKDIIAYDPNANVVMCSAAGQQNLILESLKIGAKDFITKPFQPTTIIDALSKNAFNNMRVQPA
jgi:two-component system chemotaxis response regulator CheY